MGILQAARLLFGFHWKVCIVNVSSVNTSLQILVKLLLGCVSHWTVCLNMGSAGQLAVATAVLIRHNPGKLSGSLLEAQVEGLSKEAGMWFSLWEGPVTKGEGTQACHSGGDGGKRGAHGGVRAWSVRMKEMPWVSTWEDARSYSKIPSLIIRQASRRPSLVVQRLRLHAPNAGGTGSFHGQEGKSQLPQLRPGEAK